MAKLYTFKADVTREESFYLSADSEEEARKLAIDANNWHDSFDVSGVAKKVANLKLTEVEEEEDE